jgi:hypothetical protein
MRRAPSLIAALLLIVAACVGDDDDREYLEAVAAGNRLMEADTFAALPRGDAPTRERIAGVVDARQAGLDRLRELTPPSAFQVEHQALVITLEILADETRRFMARTVDLDEAGFLDAVDAAVDLDILAEAVGRACRALEGRAAEEGHEVDLRC